jgi:NAD(P)-dependent dehydrogenase (short-subunit alcohol dehydrogenase family)
MRRASEPEEIAEVIAFLASRASELHHRQHRGR